MQCLPRFLRSFCARTGALSPLVSFLVAACGCGGSAWQREVIYSASGVTIYREWPKDGGERKPPTFLHPVRVNPDLLEAAFSTMKYQERPLFRSVREVPLFVPEEARELSLPMSLALRSVGPTERLRFLVTRSNWSEMFVGTSGTSAVVFRDREGILDVAFDYVHEKLLGAENGDPAEVVYREEPTEVVSGHPLVPGPGLKIRALSPATSQGPSGAEDQAGAEGSAEEAEPELVFPRWFEVSLAEVAAARPAPAGGGTPGGGTPGGGTAGGGTAGGTAAGHGVPRGSGPEEAVKPRDDVRYKELRHRIETLKRLRADGALSEEEYERALESALSEVGKP
jgi:hypothetical protein